MSIRRCFQGSSGVTLLELVIATMIGSIVVATAMQSQRYITRSASRENDKALVQRDILTVTDFLEKDIRMAGLGLPGNGIEANLSDTASDELRIFINEQRQSSVLTAPASALDYAVFVENGLIMKPGQWVCLAGTDTVYKEISRVGMNAMAADTVYLTEQIGVGNYPAASLVYPAIRIEYYVKNVSGPDFVRKKNNFAVNLSGLLDTMNIVPKDSFGVPLSGSISSARVLTVVFGGMVGSGSSGVLMAESTEVNIRNRL